jgi:hypothetical protein
MEIEGNIRKMRTQLNGVVQYTLPLRDVLDAGVMVPLNDLIGGTIKLEFLGHYNSVLSGKKMKKPFGEGLTYNEFMESPIASPSIIRPELSRIHEGIALRDFEWEMEHHMQPHIVYLSLTNGVKVGVTRDTQIPTRWIDQGAVQAIILAETPFRGAAGWIEVALKEYVADKTHWQKMLKNDVKEGVDLVLEKQTLVQHLSEELKQYVSPNDDITYISYPVNEYPLKVKSMKLDKVPIIEKTLIGIKGQYLIFDDQTVLNVRSHSGCRVRFTY